MKLGRARGWAVAALLPLAAGCFRYTSVQPGTVAAGTPVRAHLAEAQDLFVGNVQIARVVMTEGDLVRIDGDSAVIAVLAVQQSDSSRRNTARALVWVPRNRLARLEQKTLDRGRSALVAAGIAAAGALLAEALLGGETHGGGPPADPGPIASRAAAIPLIRIPIPF